MTVIHPMVIGFRINNNQNFQKAYPCHFNFLFFICPILFRWNTILFCLNTTILFRRNIHNFVIQSKFQKYTSKSPREKIVWIRAWFIRNTWIIRYLSQSSRASRSFLKSGQIFLASRKSPLLHFFSHQGELSRGLEFWRLTILFVVVFFRGFFGGGCQSVPPPLTARPALPQFFKKMLPACMCM